jgi:hypothetical protein
MAGIVTVHYWPSRILNSEAKSLTGHVALACEGVYASWAPQKGEEFNSMGNKVYPEPRGTYEKDVASAGGTHSVQVEIKGLDVEAIRASWQGLAGNMAGGGVHGPPIAYRLAPKADHRIGVSCATFVVLLLQAGGSDAIVKWTQMRAVTPSDVYLHARKLAAAKR